MSTSSIACATFAIALAAHALPAVATDSRQILTPVADVSSGPGWTIIGDEDSFAAALADVRPDASLHDGLATAVRSVEAEGILEVRLKAGGLPRGTRDGDHILHVFARDVAAPARYRVALLQGEQLIWTSQSEAGAAFSDRAFVVPRGAATSITDYTDLRVRFYRAGPEHLFLTKVYLEMAEDRAPSLELVDTPMLVPDTTEVIQFEVDPLARAAVWIEHDSRAGDEWVAYCALIDQTNGHLMPADGHGAAMGPVMNKGAPQIGRTTAGAFAVALTPEGYLVTCDVDEEDVFASRITVWSGPDLDPDDANPAARALRTVPFATKDYTQGHRIVVYDLFNPTTGALDLRAVDLDADPLRHVTIWSPPPTPPGQVDGIHLVTQRTQIGTPYWYWGGFPDAVPGRPVEVYAADLSDLSQVTPWQVTDSPDDVLFGFPFIGDDGLQRWAANYKADGIVSAGLRVFVEAAPFWQLEGEYPIDSALWTPSFVRPGRGQSAEAAGPDAAGHYYAVWSTHDYQDALGPISSAAYGKIAMAVIGRPERVTIVSRKQNHQTQTEPEPYIVGGTLYVAYTETRRGLTEQFGASGETLRVVEVRLR